MNEILLAEDEKNIALTLKKRLERAGYTVEVEKDGVRVLDRCLEEDWGLVLLDLQLPRMD
ncbi:MAG: response regulator, partial [bacterium]